MPVSEIFNVGKIAIAIAADDVFICQPNICPT